VVYEYVPPTDQSKIVQVDQVDDLPKKNLVTYALRTRLLEQGLSGGPFNWLDLTVAQSYRPGAAQTEARLFPLPGTPQFGTLTQPLQPPQVHVDGKKFSDVWLRGMVGNLGPAPPGKTSTSLLVDGFLDPYRGKFSQWNTDLRIQYENRWYVDIGQRYTKAGNRVRRGDIWNPISFNEVFAPTPEVQYASVGGAVRLPFNVTVGAKTYYDIKTGTSPETDVVGLYQNPCKCWALGVYYLDFPDRAQYNFVFSLTGVSWTEGVGTATMKGLLGPLLYGERGLPWASPTGPYGKRPVEPALPPTPAAK
jgi:LPS-assembly protein